MIRHIHKGFLSLGCVLISSCLPVPEAPEQASTPDLRLPKKFKTPPLETPEISNKLLGLYKSSQLNNLVGRALKNNPSLKSSATSLEVAALNIKRSKTGLLPTANFGGETGRTGANNNSAGRYSVSANASWEIDVWKKIDTQIIASENDLALQQANHRAARESIAAQVMQDWIRLIRANKLIDLSKKRLESFRKTEKLVNRKFENGTSNLGAVSLAEADVASALAEVTRRQNDRDLVSRSLYNLLGQ